MDIYFWSVVARNFGNKPRGFRNDNSQYHMPRGLNVCKAQNDFSIFYRPIQSKDLHITENECRHLKKWLEKKLDEI